MIELLTAVLWTGFASYTAWYFIMAKDYAPLSQGEARLLWKIHKQEVKCQSTRWRKIVCGGKIIGFECGCGYRYVQKRPIALRSPSPRNLEVYTGRAR